MGYEIIKKNEENSFFLVTEKEILDVEKELDLKFPKELIRFYIEVGYGFINGSEFNTNRIMDPYSVR
ncbi:SMI1/KNR4 family protein, partial [Bacillus altitudinis]